MKKKAGIVVGIVTLGVVAGTWWVMSDETKEDTSAVAGIKGASAALQTVAGTGRLSSESPQRTGGESDGSASTQEENSEELTPQTEEERSAAAEEAKVDAFDALTDKWMEPSKAGVAMKDVDGFVVAFRQVPKARQDECIHRALNLIPDENVMLLAGVLMDKSMDKEIVETVFNDILNRDEDVKKPILQQIFKDKTHPCWADTAWILDVTGETPAR